VWRTFTPGSEWVYAKLYCGAGTADRSLLDTVGPVSRKLLSSGAIDRWFFIRYADPDPHIRWRLHARPGARVASIQRRIEAAAASLLAAGRVRRVAFDTYEREVERYGGSAGIEAAEQWFWADSEAVLDLLSSLDGTDRGADARWQVAVVSVDALLGDFGLDLEARLRLSEKQRAAFGREFRAGAALGRQLAAKFRSARRDLERLLASTSDRHSRPHAVLMERSARSRAAFDDLRESARTGALPVQVAQLAESYVHMHLNRWFRAEQRTYELVIYDFLRCLYEGRVARLRTSVT
jgi:thiopeptide-type bacteriocin biosynthesis protein